MVPRLRGSCCALPVCSLNECDERLAFLDDIGGESLFVFHGERLTSASAEVI
jgi:hypothetical protein